MANKQGKLISPILKSFFNGFSPHYQIPWEMENSMLNRLKFREKTILHHLENYLLKKGFVIENFEKIAFEVEIDKNNILVSKGFMLYEEGSVKFVEQIDFLNLISLKSKRMLNLYTPKFIGLRIIIFPTREYLFEYISEKSKIE